jgi:hypothetical protein
MKQFLYICCILGLLACNSNKQQPAQEFKPTPTGLQGIQKPAASNSAPTTSQANSNSGALNPAHGQPGHSCAIPVGAPLNSAPAQTSTTQQVVTTQPTTKVTQQSPTPSVNEKGQKLNPAHGMPGHSCEIPVGAPLK